MNNGFQQMWAEIQNLWNHAIDEGWRVYIITRKLYEICMFIIT